MITEILVVTIIITRTKTLMIIATEVVKRIKKQ